MSTKKRKSHIQILLIGVAVIKSASLQTLSEVWYRYRELVRLLNSVLKMELCSGSMLVWYSRKGEINKGHPDENSSGCLFGVCCSKEVCTITCFWLRLKGRQSI